MRTKYYQFVTLMGQIVEVHPSTGFFKIRLLSGDDAEIRAGGTTYYEVLSNLDGIARDRVDGPARNEGENDFEYDLRKYIQVNLISCVQGVHSITERVDARRVVLMHSNPGRYAWEDTHWWISQVNWHVPRPEALRYGDTEN